VLRPLYQEFLLPNVAVVGGPAEMAYWLQYKKMLEHFGVNFPILVLRKSFMLPDEKSMAIMQQLDLKVEDLFLSADELIKKFLAGIPGVNLDNERKAIEKTFSSIIEKLSKTDVTLKASAEAERENVLKSLDKLEAKLRKAEKNKHEIEIGKIKKLKEKLFPEGTSQERYENFIPYYLKYEEEFFDILLGSGDAFDFKLNVLLEEKQATTTSSQ
jgi:bacillithiol synthase